MADVPPGLKDLINAAQRALHGDNRLTPAQVAGLQQNLSRLQGMAGQINDMQGGAVTRRAALVASGAALAGDKLMRPMNAPPPGVMVPGVQPGTSSGVVVAQLVLIVGSHGGVFVYHGTPASGNPPIGWISNEGLVDPFGNTLPAIMGVESTGSFSAGDTLITPTGVYTYSAAPAAGLLIASMTPAAGTDPFGDVTAQGVAAYVTAGGRLYAVGLNVSGPGGLPGLTVANTASAPTVPAGFYAESSASGTIAEAAVYSGQATGLDVPSQVIALSQLGSGITNGFIEALAGRVRLGNSNTLFVDDNAGVVGLQNNLNAAPSAPIVAGSGLYSNVNGNASVVEQSGWAGQISVVQSDVSVLTNNNLNGANRVSAIYTIPAGDLKVGTEYCIEVPVLATFAGVAADTLELGLSIDGSTSYSTNNTINGAIVGAGNSINGVFRVYLKCVTTGVSGTINTWTDGSTNATSATTTFANSGGLVGNLTAAATLDTTAQHTIRVNSTWAVSNATQALTVRGSKCTRTGP